MIIPNYITISVSEEKMGLTVSLEGDISRFKPSCSIYITQEKIDGVGRDKAIKMAKCKLIEREEYEFGKHLDDVEFRKYIEAKFKKNKPSCYGCQKTKFILLGEFEQFAQCSNCEHVYSKNQYEDLQGIASRLDAMEINSARYKYGKQSSKETSEKIAKLHKSTENIEAAFQFMFTHPTT